MLSTRYVVPISLEYFLELIPSVQWQPEVSYFAKGAPIVLVGTKMDVRTQPKTKAMKQPLVTKEEADVVAKKIGAIAHVECSAMTQEGLKTVFDTAIRASLARRTAPPAQSKMCAIL